MRTPVSSVYTGRRRQFVTCAAVTLAAGIMALNGSGAAAATGAAPYKDPGATAVVGFCDRAGHQVTGGRVAATPFVYHAVSSAPATAPYDAPGRTASLVAFQPRRGVPAADWSGDQLTASTRYSDAAHPTAAATRHDLSLEGFVEEFPPAWDGLVQLRLLLSAPNQAADSTSYAATTIRVTGKTWQVLGGGTVDCASGKARSIESILLPHVGKAGSGGSQSTAATIGGTHVAAQTAPTHSGGTPTAGAAALPASSGTANGHSGLLTGGIIALVALLAGGGLLAVRRRRS